MNDIISPGFCKYQTQCAFTDTNNMVSIKNRDRISEQHSFKHKEEEAYQNDRTSVVCYKKSIERYTDVQMKDISIQTVIGLSEARSMRKGKLVEYRHVDRVLISPKDH